MKKKCQCHKYGFPVCGNCQEKECGKSHAKISRFKNSKQDRINFLRKQILSVVSDHGTPCGCVLCETLILDTIAREGTINLKTGERK